MKTARRAVAISMWAFLAVFAAHQTAIYLINIKAKSYIGRGVIDGIGLVGLSLRGPGGEGRIGDVRVAWGPLRFSPTSGGKLDWLEIGPKGQQLLVVEDLKLKPGTGFAGVAGKVTARPFRPGWEGLKPVSARPSKTQIPIDLFIEHLVIETPVGEFSGRAGICHRKDGLEGEASAHLRDVKGRDIDLQLEWAESGMKASVWGGSGVEGYAFWGGVTSQNGFFRFSMEVAEGRNSWALHGDGGGDTPAIFLLQNNSDPNRGGGLTIFVRTDKGDGGRNTAVDILGGEICLPDVIFSEKAIFSRNVFKVENSSIDIKNNAIIGCTSISFGSDLNIPAKAVNVPINGNLNLRWTPELSGAIYVSMAGEQLGALEKLGKPLVIRGDLESAHGGDYQWRIGIGGPGVRAEAEGGATGDGLTGAVRLIGVKELGLSGQGWVRRDLSWGVKGILTAGEHAMPGVTLDGCPLLVNFEASGAGGAGIGVFAAGKGRWGSLDFKLNGEEWEGGGRGLSLSMGGVEISKLALRGAGKGLPWPISGGSWGEELRFNFKKDSKGEPLDVMVRLQSALGHGVEGQVNVNYASGARAFEGMLNLDKVPQGSYSLEIGRGRLEIPEKKLLADGLSASMLQGDSGLTGTFSSETLSIGDFATQGRVDGKLALELEPVKNLYAEVHSLAFGGDLSMGYGYEEGGKSGLSLAAKGLSCKSFLGFVSRWWLPPIAFDGGTFGGFLTCSFSESGIESLKGDLIFNDATVDLSKKLLRSLSGPLRLSYGGGKFEASSGEGFSAEKGGLPASLAVAADSDKYGIKLVVPPADAGVVQNAFFDFLPEYVGYGSMSGKLGLDAWVKIDAARSYLSADLSLDQAEFVSEDKALKVEGISGRLPLYVAIDPAGQAPSGYRHGALSGQEEFFNSLGDMPGGNSTARVERLGFSVFEVKDIEISSWVDSQQSVMRLGGSFLGGSLSSEARLALSAEGMKFAAASSVSGLSLQDFFRATGGTTGFISGDVDGRLTLRADRLGLSALKGIGDFKVNPGGREPMILGKDFLANLGGEQIKKLVKAEELPYDEAELGFLLNDGRLTFKRVKLSHAASPFKALFRKDLSYEINVPGKNSISVWNLLDTVKSLEGKQAKVE